MVGAGAIDALRAHVDARGAVRWRWRAWPGSARPPRVWAADHGREEGRVVVEGRSVLGLAEPRSGLRPRRSACRAASSHRCATWPPAPRPGPPRARSRGRRARHARRHFEAAARYSAPGRIAWGLVVLEDLHWADATSVSLIRSWRGRCEGRRSALSTYRAGDERSAGARLEGLRAEMRRSRLGDELTSGRWPTRRRRRCSTRSWAPAGRRREKAELLRLAGGNPSRWRSWRGPSSSPGGSTSRGPATGNALGGGPWTWPSRSGPALSGSTGRSRARRVGGGHRRAVRLPAADRRERDRARRCARRGMASLVRAGLVVEAPDDAGHLFAFRHAWFTRRCHRRAAAQRRGRHERILAATERLVAEGTLETSAAELARHAMARAIASVPALLPRGRRPGQGARRRAGGRRAPRAGCRCGRRTTAGPCGPSSSSPPAACGRGWPGATSGR